MNSRKSSPLRLVVRWRRRRAPDEARKCWRARRRLAVCKPLCGRGETRMELVMASQEDVRRIALSLPEAFQEDGGFAFAVLNKGKRKGFAWVWMERIVPKKPRVPNPD